MWVGPAAQKIKKYRKCRNKNFACLRKNIFLSRYSLISGLGIKKIKVKYIDFLLYLRIFTNARVGIIHGGIFTNAKVGNIRN
jgi:hypothetical protein